MASLTHQEGGQVRSKLKHNSVISKVKRGAPSMTEISVQDRAELQLVVTEHRGAPHLVA